MQYDLISAWRNSPLYHSFQSNLANAGYVNKSRSPGLGMLGSDTSGQPSKSKFGSDYQLSLSPMAKHWNLRNHTAGLSGDERKRLIALALAEEQIKGAAKAKEANTTTEEATQQKQAAAEQAYSSSSSSRRRASFEPQVVEAPPTPIEAAIEAAEEEEVEGESGGSGEEAGVVEDPDSPEDGIPEGSGNISDTGDSEGTQAPEGNSGEETPVENSGENGGAGESGEPEAPVDQPTGEGDVGGSTGGDTGEEEDPDPPV